MYVHLLSHLVKYLNWFSMYVVRLRFLGFGFINENFFDSELGLMMYFRKRDMYATWLSYDNWMASDEHPQK